MNALKRLYRGTLSTLPPELAKTIKQSADWIRSPANRWTRRYYTPAARQPREDLLLLIARFCHINRPIEGYYFEFGCHEANTMRAAWKHFRHLFNWHFVAFDSFEGLPEIKDIDKQPIWQAGKLKTSNEDFVRLCRSAGMPANRLSTVKGFYDQSLNEQTQARFLGSKAAVVYIDCDLYASTVPILKFIVPFLQRGTVIVFDDWACFHNDPNRGERLAWREFTEAHPELAFSKLYEQGELAAFVSL